MLDVLIQCPFRFMVERLLGIEQPEQVDEDRFPLVMGLVIHDALHRFYSKWARDGHGPITDASRHLAGAMLAEAADQAINARPLTSFMRELLRRRMLGFGGTRDSLRGGPARTVSMVETIRGHRGILAGFLEFEIERYESGEILRPKDFEVAFGTRSGRDDDIVELEMGGERVKVCGRADRLDADDRYYALVDYKTGYAPSNKAQNQGYCVQIPLYLMAFDRILRQQDMRLEAAGGVYYGVKPRETRFAGHFFRKDLKDLMALGRAMCLTEERFQQNLQLVRERIAYGIERFRRGQFHLTVADEKIACAYCACEQVCRKNLPRVRRLVPEMLERALEHES
jgi:RecB family exonuclease